MVAERGSKNKKVESKMFTNLNFIGSVIFQSSLPVSLKSLCVSHDDKINLLKLEL